MSVRTDVAAQLTTDWAAIPALAGLRVVATERALDDIQRPTALLRQSKIARTPSAPNSHRTVTMLLTIISPHLDLDKAGDQLDTLVTAALDYLDPRFIHDDADAVAYASRLAYDISISIIARKDA